MSCSDSKVIDNVKHYLRSIGEYPVLTQAEEVALFKRIKEGDKEAKHRLIRCNLKLVVSAARQYAHFSIPLMDLIQEGNLGLMKATEGFDPSMGYRFSTYAMQWIRQYISRFIMDKGKVIHVPVHVIEHECKVRKARDMLFKELRREPTVKELAKETGFSEEQVARLMNLIQEPISIDRNVNDDNDLRLSDLIGDPHAGQAIKGIHDEFMRADIIKALAVLNEREKDIVIKHFGLNNEQALTLEEIGKKYGISRERVRQIESAAIRKLRSPKVRELLEAYFHDLK